MIRKGLLFLILYTYSGTLVAQDTLPKFTVIKKIDGNAFIKWVNDYGVVKQITIQRSTDSLKRFATIFTSPNALAKSGEFLDTKSKNVNFFYRIFIQLPEGIYFYTNSQKGILSSNVIIKPTDTTIKTVPKNPNVFIASNYVFTDNKSNVIITLPDAEKKNYRITFLDELGNKVLQIPKVLESNLIMEKYNFTKYGWYIFEVYLDNKLWERNKVNIKATDIKKP